MFVAQQPSTFLDFFLSKPNVAAFHISYLFPTSPQQKHNDSLYDFDGIYGVYVEDFVSLLRRCVLTGLIDSSYLYLALYPFWFWLSIVLLQLLCHSTKSSIIRCNTSCVPLPPELLVREIPPLSQILPRNPGNQLTCLICSTPHINNCSFASL